MRNQTTLARLAPRGRWISGVLAGIGLVAAGAFGCAHAGPAAMPVSPVPPVSPGTPATPPPAFFVRTVPFTPLQGPLEPVGPFTLDESFVPHMFIHPVRPCNLDAPMLAVNGLVAPCWAVRETIEAIAMDSGRTVRVTFVRGSRAQRLFGPRATRAGGVLWVVTRPGGAD